MLEANKSKLMKMHITNDDPQPIINHTLIEVEKYPDLTNWPAAILLCMGFASKLDKSKLKGSQTD